MRFNRRGPSAALRGILHARTLLLAAVCTLLIFGSQAHAQIAVPAEPTGLSAASITHDSITLSWDDPSDNSITGYQVLRRSRDGEEYGDGRGAAEFVSIVDDTGPSATTYTDTSVTPRTRYVYRVKAINPAGTSRQSPYLNVETPAAPTPPSAAPTPPSAAPTSLAAPTVSHHSATISWDVPGDDSITGYQVLRRSRDGDVYEDGLGAAEFVPIIDDTGSSATTYTDTSVAPRTRYVYRVKAINPAGTSGQSSYLNVETPAAPTSPSPPAAPTSLAVSSATHDSVSLTWDDPGDSTIESYQVLRRSLDGDEYGDGEGDAELVVIVDDIGSSDTTYTDTSVTARTRYVYRVKARNPQGLSGVSSNINTETLDAPPDTPQSPVQGSRPNVVLILADDLGWGDIQSNNPDSAMTTPRIDGIAAAGANFTDAHSPSSMCSPTRYGLLTGRYAWRTWLSEGVLGGHDRPLIGPGRATLGTLLQGHGYRTAAVGKWHLGMDFARLSNIEAVTPLNRGIDLESDIEDGPLDHGFDEFFGTSANLSWEPHVYIHDRRFTGNPDGGNQPESGLIRAKEVLGRLTEEGVGFIERAAPEDDPFFLYLPLNAPHVPMAPNDHFRDSTDLGLYGDFVAQIDWTVGQVLDALERAGARENTLVIFTSDNGSYMGGLPNHLSNDHTEDPRAFYYRYDTHQSNGGWFGLKGTINEGGHRVPLLVQWPGKIVAGSTVDATVSLTDLYATLADIMEEEPESGVATDSVSLLPLLLGESETRGTPVVHHSGAGMFALRDGRWKLVFGNGHGSLVGRANGEPFGTPWRLYDLEQDPREVRNAARANPAVMARMEAAFDRIRSTENGTLSAGAKLSKLSLAGIDIGAFNPDESSYSANVDRGIETVEVTALPTETDAGISISTPEGQLLYGKPLRGRVEVGLAESITTITVTVEAPDKSATAAYTVTVTRAGEAAIAGIPLVGETLTANTSGIAGEDGLSGASFSYQWVSNDGSRDTDIEGATSTTYVLTAGDLGKTIRVRVSFTDDGDIAETRTSPATAQVKNPLTAELQSAPDRHDGTGAFDLHILFSEPVAASYRALKEHSFQVSRGSIAEARRVDGRDDLWEISVRPDSDASVLLALPPTGDCSAAGAVCTGDGRPLSSRLEMTVPGPAPANSPAQGAPRISGAPEVGQTVTADTSAIADADGLSNAAFSYQWVCHIGSTDTDIRDATAATYSPVEDDEGKALRVRVRFTDDAGNAETLTSDPTAAVEARPNFPASGAPIITGQAQLEQTLAANTTAISDDNGMTSTIFSYRWIAIDSESETEREDATSSTYLVTANDAGKAIKVRVTFADDDGNDETLSSEATDEVSAIWVATLGVGSGTGGSGPTHYGYTSFGWGSGTISTRRFDIDRKTYELLYLLWGPDSLYFGLSKELAPAFTLHIGPASFESSNAVEEEGEGVYRHNWYQGELNWTEGDEVPVALTLADESSAPNAPTTPTGLSAPSVTHDRVTLSWDVLGDDSITGYRIFRRDIANQSVGTFTTIESNTGSTATSYIDSTVSTRTRYAYRIQAINPEGVSGQSDYVNVRTAAAPRPEVMDAGPAPANSAAEGAPTITVTPEVGQTVTADTSGISDADGLSSASFGFQWVSSDGGEDTDIEGATSATYVLTAEDLRKTVLVRVSFTDDRGNAETRISAATPTVRRGGVVVWEGEFTAGQEAGILPVRYGYSRVGKLGGKLSPDTFVVDGTTFTVQSLMHASEGLWLEMDGEMPVDFTLRVGDSAHRGSESQVPLTTSLGAYWWPSTPPDWLGDDPVRVGLTVHPEVPSGSRQKAPVTGYFHSFPPEHDGIEDVSFRIFFSEVVSTTAGALRDHVLSVSGGTVSSIEAVEHDDKMWVVSVTPESTDTVTIEMEADLDCALADAVCTADGRRLINRMELEVAGPPPPSSEPTPRPGPKNNPATGPPTIRGEARLGATLRVSLSALDDADGLSVATFTYQWLADDAEIDDATGSTYVLDADDEGRTIRVRVSFTDDAGNEETLTSAATKPVAPR